LLPSRPLGIALTPVTSPWMKDTFPPMVSDDVITYLYRSLLLPVAVSLCALSRCSKAAVPFLKMVYEVSAVEGECWVAGQLTPAVRVLDVGM